MATPLKSRILRKGVGFFHDQRSFYKAYSHWSYYLENPPQNMTTIQIKRIINSRFSLFPADMLGLYVVVVVVSFISNRTQQ